MAIYTLKKVEAGDKFISLSDTPSSFIGSAGKILRVNQQENALVFDDEELLEIASGATQLGGATKLTFKGLKVVEDSAGKFSVEGLSIPDNLENFDMPMWDTDTSKFVPSGIKSVEGNLVEVNSITSGSHTLRGLGDELGYIDEYTGKDYALVTQELPLSGNSYPVAIKFIDATIQNLVVNSNVSDNVSQPEWPMTVSDSMVIYGIILNNVVTPTNVATLRAFISGKEVFRDKMPSLVAGQNRVDFSSPIVVRAGQYVQFNILEPLDEFVVKGHGDVPAHTLLVRKFTDDQIITGGVARLPIKQDDGGEPVIQATSIAFPTASVFVGENGEAVIDTAFGITKAGESEQGDIVSLEIGDDFDLSVSQVAGRSRGNKASITLNKSGLEAKHTPAYLAYFGNPAYIGYSEGATPTNRINTVYPEEIVVDSNDQTKILANSDDMTFTLNKLDGFDSSDYLVSVRLAFRQTRWDIAWNTGFISLSLMDMEGNPLTDVYGVPMVIRHVYNANDALEPIQLTSILRIHGETTFQIVTDTNLSTVQPVITPRNEGASGIMIQSLTHLSKTSDAMQQFEHEVGEKFPLTYRTFGSNLVDFSYLNAPDRGPFVAGAPSALIRSDGNMFHSVNGFSWQVQGGVFSITGNGQPVDGSFAQIFDAVSTQFLLGKSLSVSAEYSSNVPWKISLLKWTGAPDQANTELFSSRPVNGQPTWKDGWSVVDTLDLTIADTNFVTLSKTFTIPQDAVQFTIVLYPSTVSTATTFSLRSLSGSLTQQVTGWYLGDRKTIGEPSSRKLNDLITFVQDNQGVAGISYPITNTQSPIPFGKLVTWHSTVPAPSVNPVTTVAQNQRQGEGGVLFEAEGVLEFSGTQLLIVNTGATSQTVTFKYKVKHGDGTIEDLTDSQTVFTVVSNNGSGQFFRMKEFTYHCKANDVLFLVATSSGASGLKLYGLNAAYPMVKGSLVYKKILPTSYDSPAITPVAFGATQLDTVDTTYSLTAANTAQTMPLNTLMTTAAGVSEFTLDNANDTVKLGKAGVYWLSYNAHVIRTQQWNQAVKYGVWLEYSTDNGATWTYLNGSSYVLDIPQEQPSSPNPISLSVPFEATVDNIRIRGRHAASIITNGIGIKSYAATAVFPATSAWRLVGKLM